MRSRISTILQGFVLLLLGLLALPGWAATYQAQTVQSFGTGDDAISAEIPLGFSFRFGGSTYDRVRIQSNGRLQFGGNTWCNYGSVRINFWSDFPRQYTDPIPDADLDLVMRGFGADFDPDTGGQVTYAVLGNAPNRRFVVTWSSVPEYITPSTSISLQMVLYEDGRFEYRYGNISRDTARFPNLPEIGWQLSGSDYAVWSYTSTADLENTAILWQVPQPVAYWAMDESSWSGAAGEVVDGTGNGHDGRAVGNARPLPAKVCNGADLNGLGGILTDYIEVPDNNALDMPTEVSVSIWVYPRRYPPSGLMTILSKDTNYEFHLNSSGRVYWWWRDNNGTVRNFTTNAAVPLNQWTHIAITYRSGEQVIYLNGTPAATRTWTGGLATNNLPLFLGDDRITSRRWVGKLDEARLFNTALSPEQVRYWMDATHPCPPTPVTGCSDVFPMALQNTDPAASIELEDATQVLGSPGNQLGTINLQDSSTLPSCGATNCTASGTVTPPALVPAFQTTSTNYDVTVPNGGSFALMRL